VPVEVVVNGLSVGRRRSPPTGKVQPISFRVPIAPCSSWIALRILPSSHTNPIFVEVAGSRSARRRRAPEWCLKGVDQCWSQRSADPGVGARGCQEGYDVPGRRTRRSSGSRNGVSGSREWPRPHRSRRLIALTLCAESVEDFFLGGT